MNYKAMTISAVALLLLTGCRVESKHNANDENVKITTPFGGMSVKTDNAEVQGSVGLSPYPGATQVKNDKNNNAADVNVSFGSFHIGVKALEYRTTDAPDKVLAFYRKDMVRYGVVLQCLNGKPMGTPTTTQDGLSCRTDQGDTHIHTDSDGGDAGELKAGSRQHQHLVQVDQDGAGTKFGLVALDLPTNLSGKDGDTD